MLCKNVNSVSLASFLHSYPSHLPHARGNYFNKLFIYSSQHFSLQTEASMQMYSHLPPLCCTEYRVLRTQFCILCFVIEQDSLETTLYQQLSIHFYGHMELHGMKMTQFIFTSPISYMFGLFTIFCYSDNTAVSNLVICHVINVQEYPKIPQKRDSWVKE